MKAIGKFVFLTLLGLLLASNASATTIFGPGYNSISYNNYENLIQIEPGSSQIQAGDRFYGIATFTSVDWASTTNTTQDWVPILGNQYVQAYFYTEVDSVDTSLGRITFKTPTSPDPNGIFSAADLASGVVLKWFESDTPLDFSTNVADSIASAVDGNLLMALSLTGGYWYSDAVLTIPTASGQSIGTSLYGLNLVGGSIGDLVLINDPEETLENLDVNFYGQSKIQTIDANNAGAGLWAFYSSDPAVIATPEPASLVLLGAGLLGIVALRRRQKNS